MLDRIKIREIKNFAPNTKTRTPNTPPTAIPHQIMINVKYCNVPHPAVISMIISKKAVNRKTAKEK